MMNKYDFWLEVTIVTSFFIFITTTVGMAIYFSQAPTQQVVVQSTPCPSSPPLEAGIPEAIEYFDTASGSSREDCQEKLEAWIYAWTESRK